MKAAQVLLAGLLLSTASLSATASPCSPERFTSGFLPAGPHSTGGRVPIICGLPASQNPVAGTTEDQERMRKAQIKDWSRILNEKTSAAHPRDKSTATDTDISAPTD